MTKEEIRKKQAECFAEVTKINYEVSFNTGYDTGVKDTINKACEYLKTLTHPVGSSEGGSEILFLFSQAEIALFKEKMMEE